MRTCMFTFAAALAVSTAFAHGPQLQLTRETVNGTSKIVTRKIILEEPYTHLTPQNTVYVMPMGTSSGAWYSRPNVALNPITMLPAYTSGPGIAYGFDQVDGGPRDFVAGTRFELNLIDGLKWWDGASFVDPGSEQIEAHRLNSMGQIVASAITSDSLTHVTPATMAYGNISATYGQTAHSGALFRLLGDGSDPLSESDNGVYLLKMTYSNTEVGLQPSDPFYFVLNKNASQESLPAAVSSLGVAPQFVQFVPEPFSVAMAAMGVAMMFLRNRRRSCDRR